MIHARSWMALALAGAGICPAGQALDSMEFGKDRKSSGLFVEYKNSIFYFRTREGELLKKPNSEVEKLTLDPAVESTLFLFGKAKGETVTLKGFEKPVFCFQKGGQDSTQALARVRAVKPTLTLSRGAIEDDGVEVVSEGDEVEITNFVSKGSVTVIHFADKSNPSEKNGHYLGVLAEKSHGRMKVVKIEVPNGACPVAKQYQIVSLPQFWFYGKDGKLTKKLTERFMPADVDSVVKQVLGRIPK